MSLPPGYHYCYGELADPPFSACACSIGQDHDHRQLADPDPDVDPHPMIARRGVEVGSTIYGFCNGFFGRDSYGDKRIIAMGTWNGEGWIVAEEDERLVTATGNFWPFLSEWATPGAEDE